MKKIHFSGARVKATDDCSNEGKGVCQLSQDYVRQFASF